MNKRQQQAIAGIVDRLKKPHVGASVGGPLSSKEINAAIELLQSHGFEVTSRLYLDTWIVPPLKLVIGDSMDQELARQLAS